MKAGLIAIAAGSLVGSVAALHEHHAKRAEYGYGYDVPAVSSSTPASAIKPSTSSAAPSVSSSSSTPASAIKPSTSSGAYYDYPVSSSSSSAYKSSSTPVKPVTIIKSSSSSYSKVPKYTSSGTLVAPSKPVEICLATSTTTVTVYVDDFTSMFSVQK